MTRRGDSTPTTDDRTVQLRTDGGPSGGDAASDEGVVLVVDDDEAFAETVRLWLASDWTVRVANDGDDAIEAYDPNVDVALLDRRMPTLSGDEVLQSIREADGNTAVAMMTAVSPSGDIIEMEFDTYLQKPVDQTELQQVVETLFQRAQYAPEIRALLRLGSKLETFQETYRDDELAENSHYQRLKSDFNDEHERVEENLDALDEEERDELDRIADAIA